MFKTLFTALAFGMLLSVTAKAETLDTRLKLCISGNLSDVEKDALITELSELTITFSAYVEQNSAACFTKLTGRDAEYSKGSGLVFDPDAIETVKAAKINAERESVLLAEQKAVREAKLLALANDAAELRTESKCKLLTEREDYQTQLLIHEETITAFELAAEARIVEAKRATIEECNSWAEDDLRAAVTNPVCQQVFTQTGLPGSEVLGPSIADFIEAEVSFLSLSVRIAELDRDLAAISDEEEFVKRYSELELQERKLDASGQVEFAEAMVEDDGC